MNKRIIKAARPTYYAHRITYRKGRRYKGAPLIVRYVRAKCYTARELDELRAEHAEATGLDADRIEAAIKYFK